MSVGGKPAGEYPNHSGDNMTSKLVPPNMIERVNRPHLSIAHFFNIVPRPGSLDALKEPSNIGGKLYYPEVKLERIKGKK